MRADIMAWLRTLLQKQKKNDYKPSNDEISFARNTTEPCQACCDYLAYVKEAVDEGLSGKNAEAYLTEVGVAFHRYVQHQESGVTLADTGEACSSTITSASLSTRQVASCSQSQFHRRPIALRTADTS